MSSVPRRFSHGIDVAICFFSPNHPTLSASPYRLNRPPPAPPLSLPRPTLTITITPSRHRAATLSLLPHNYTFLTALPRCLRCRPVSTGFSLLLVDRQPPLSSASHSPAPLPHRSRTAALPHPPPPPSLRSLRRRFLTVTAVTP
jgi:hypothetical protein